MKNETPIKFNTRVRAYSGQGIGTHKVAVYADGSVRVWDGVAGHYTTVHAMSDATQRRIRKEAGWIAR